MQLAHDEKAAAKRERVAATVEREAAEVYRQIDLAERKGKLFS